MHPRREGDLRQAPHTLTRATFRTSRELEYFSAKELTLQTGHEPDRWLEVVLKELLDNGLDACEGAGILPEIHVSLDADALTAEDNGPGLPAAVVRSVLDFNIRTSSKDAYVSATRGAQGNALKTVVAIPYVLSGCDHGELTITSRGRCHQIRVGVDRIAQRPVIAHQVDTDRVVKTGTRVRVRWPGLAPLGAKEASRHFLHLLPAYSLFNPHASFRLDIGAEATHFDRTTPAYRKWVVNEPTSPHWYSADQLRALMAAYIAAERRGGPARTVREFISEFRGLSGTAKQKTILSRVPLAGVHLHDLIKGGDVDRAVVTSLLEAMRAESKPVKPLALGPLGEPHIRMWLTTHGGTTETVRYKRLADVDDATGLPFLVELAFAARKDHEPRRLSTGINWAPTLVDPFRAFEGYGLGLDGLLNSLHVRPNDPVTFVLHLACPHLNYTDRGKSSLEAL